MRRAPLLVIVPLLACTGGEKAPAADTAVMTASAPALTLAELAGKWTQRVTAEGNDSVLVTSTMTATSEGSGWTIDLPGRPSQPVQVTVSGDSVMTTVGPYESVLRKGVQVTTNSVSRLVDGKLVGVAVAHYSGVMTADSVVRLRTTATRTP